MRRLALGPLYYEFSRHHPPRAQIRSGESLLVETEDAFSGQIRSNADRRDKQAMPNSNPLTGPIQVEGAEPGDSLAVTIRSIRPLLPQCATRTAEPQQLAQWLGTDVPHGTHVCKIEDDAIHWSDKIKIPYRPMLGCIGTAPANGAPTTIPAGPHGGNLDIREVCPGNTVFLPVMIQGAHLYVGDAHAAMGHGELSASGLEMTALTELEVHVVKNLPLAWPRIAGPDEIMTVVSGAPMERSLAQAYAQLILWMESEFGWDRWKAYDLLTHVAEVSIGYYALGTVAVKVARRYL
jgi:amidase